MNRSFWACAVPFHVKSDDGTSRMNLVSFNASQELGCFSVCLSRPVFIFTKIDTPEKFLELSAAGIKGIGPSCAGTDKAIVDTDIDLLLKFYREPSNFPVFKVPSMTPYGLPADGQVKILAAAILHLYKNNTSAYLSSLFNFKKVTQFICGDNYSWGTISWAFEELARSGEGVIYSTPACPNLKYDPPNICGFTVWYPETAKRFLRRDTYGDMSGLPPLREDARSNDIKSTDIRRGRLPQ